MSQPSQQRYVAYVSHVLADCGFGTPPLTLQQIVIKACHEERERDETKDDEASERAKFCAFRLRDCGEWYSDEVRA